MRVAVSQLKALDWYVMGALLLTSTVGGNYLAQHIVFPGHGDPCYYLEVTFNMLSGRGFTIDYIDYFHRLPDHITHPAGGYWQPLTSFIYYLIFLILPTRFSSVQLIAAGVSGTALITVYLLGRKMLALSPAIALASALFFALDIEWVHTIVIPQSGTFFWIFTLLFFYCYNSYSSSAAQCAENEIGSSRWVISHFFMGVIIGFAHLTRPDGILLWAVVMLSTLLDCRKHRRAVKISPYAVMLIGYMLTMMPWWIRNAMVFGTIQPVPSSTFPFITDYEQIFALHKNYSLSRYLAWGATHIVSSKISGILSCLRELVHFRMLVVAIGCVSLRPLLRKPLFKNGGLYLLSLVLVISLVLTLPGNDGRHGTFRHALPGILPLLYLAFGAGFQHILRFLRHPERMKKPWYRMLFVLYLTIIGLNFLYSTFAIWELYGYNDAVIVKQTRELYRNLKQAGSLIPPQAVVMTRNPWEVRLVTRRRAVQIPSDGAAAFTEVVERYKVTHLLLTDYRRQYVERMLRESGSEFTFVPLMHQAFRSEVFGYQRFQLYKIERKTGKDDRK